MKYQVRFKENGVLFNLTEPLSKEEAEKIYNDQTYNMQCWINPYERLFFTIKEVYEDADVR